MLKTTNGAPRLAAQEDTAILILHPRKNSLVSRIILSSSGSILSGNRWPMSALTHPHFAD
jgi:hypothetical protein